MPKKSNLKPVIVITTGDPAGIGPEITQKALTSNVIKDKADFIIVGDLQNKGKIKKGRPSAACGKESLNNVKTALKVLNCIKGRKALVTAPINKYSIKKAGSRFNGHTELLAHLTKSKNIAMIFAKDAFRIALVTRHIPVKEVSRKITKESVINTTILFYDALKNKFGIKNPKIEIAGLNPHAGESGAIGREEKTVITPALKRLTKILGYRLMPKPADSLFHDLYKRKLDGIVCMYHDQGLAPFKMLYFESGVNITLGLPFIRTSPDHGTAFDIAGKNKANPLSMIEAIKLAVKLA